MRNPPTLHLSPLPSALPECRLSLHLPSPARCQSGLMPSSLLPGQSLQNLNCLSTPKTHLVVPHCFWFNFYPPALCDVASAYLKLHHFHSLPAILHILPLPTSHSQLQSFGTTCNSFQVPWRLVLTLFLTLTGLTICEQSSQSPWP